MNEIHILGLGANAYRCPNPDRTFSRLFTASMKDGTFSGLQSQRGDRREM